MEFRVLRQPGRDAGRDDRPQAFGKRASLEPEKPSTSARQVIETVAFALGVAALAYLVVDTL